MNNYDVVIAADHAAVKLKAKIIQFLQSQRISVLNLGSDNEEKVDYPDFAHKLVEEIITKSATKGILLCGSGIGMSIAANRSFDIRAALCINEYMAKSSRTHNNANVLVLGSNLIPDDMSIKIVDIFLNTQFEGGRHAKRLAKIR